MFHQTIQVCFCSIFDKKNTPVGSLMPSCCCCGCCSRSISDWSVNLSMRSINHWRCGSAFMAVYSRMKACGFSEVCSSANSSPHCCCGSSLNLISALLSGSSITRSWNKTLMTSTGLTLLTTVECSSVKLSFNTSFNSKQLNISWLTIDFTLKSIHTKGHCVQIKGGCQINCYRLIVAISCRRAGTESLHIYCFAILV